MSYLSCWSRMLLKVKFRRRKDTNTQSSQNNRILTPVYNAFTPSLTCHKNTKGAVEYDAVVHEDRGVSLLERAAEPVQRLFVAFIGLYKTHEHFFLLFGKPVDVF
ncbi:hypothetical protein HPB48_017340 [Haemaphysalis longicornis]|uniref:Uncharacterized protein n=1 Tax=Haemaphysalis longicornis TaxID=44386 RepID=A0A9J6GPX9_HAELO|nr:hypothetical protein HPB48_017340 [Haemaphysalis longicornis]